MNRKTVHQIEHDITKGVIRIEKDYLGRECVEAHAYVIEDMILVRVQGTLTPAELKLAESHEGRSLVKETRRKLFETTRPMMGDLVRQVVGARLVSLHTDMSTSTGERIIVLVLDSPAGQTGKKAKSHDNTIK